jgi:hypothetical protein
LRTVTITGLIHSSVRAISGLGRYCATFMNAGLPPMLTGVEGELVTVDELLEAALGDVLRGLAIARSRSAGPSSWKVSALPAPAMGFTHQRVAELRRGGAGLGGAAHPRRARHAQPRGGDPLLHQLLVAEAEHRVVRSCRAGRGARAAAPRSAP